MLNYKQNIFLFIGYIQKRAALDSSVFLTNEYGEIISVDHRYLKAKLRLDQILNISQYYSMKVPIQAYSAAMVRFFNHQLGLKYWEKAGETRRLQTMYVRLILGP